MIPIVFGPRNRQLLGMFHPPETAVGFGAGVVLCNPLGYESMCAHRMYRHLATRLAAAGLAVLRFDYLGTGDSSGRGDERDGVRAWLDSISMAVDELRALGNPTTHLFGVRLGATLAALAAEELRRIDGLVLWAPAISGRAYAREARALQMLRQNGGRAPSQPTPLYELSTVNLLEQRGAFVTRALVVPRDDLPSGEKELVEHYEASGIRAELRAEPGYARMMDHPETSIVPSDTLDSIVGWVRQGLVPCRVSPGAPTPLELAPSRVLTTWSDDPRRPVREEALTFGEGNRLFGILTEGDPPNGAQTAVVFLNAGANHRVGPNRLYVSLARDLAARGYPAFRFDVGGLGDGTVAPGMAENRVYSRDSVADVQAAMTFLSATRGATRFVLVGICSGGFLAFHTSADDERVVGQIVINPQTFDWKDGDPLEVVPRKTYKSTRYYVEALRNPTAWTRAFRGELDVRGIVRTLRLRSTARASLRWKSLVSQWRGLPGSATPIERVFRTVSDRGVRSLLVFSSNDGGLDMIEEHLGSEASRMRGHPNFRLEVIEGADHTFTPPEAQERLRALITFFVEASWPTRSHLLGSVAPVPRARALERNVLFRRGAESRNERPR